MVITDDENTEPILEAGAIEAGLDDLLKKYQMDGLILIYYCFAKSDAKNW